MALYDDVVNRLGMFNCEVAEEQKKAIQYLIGKTLSSINNYTNQNYNEENMPYGIYYIVVDKVAGEYLSSKRITGDLEGYDFTPLIKDIQEGDTKIGYSTSLSQADLIDKAIDFLINGKDEELIKYRRLAW